MKKAKEWKGVFCLEGLWENDLKLNSSVEPVLELLNKQYPKLKYIHGDCATVEEVRFYLKKWVQKGYRDYPILYLAFHGEENRILVSGGQMELDEIAAELKDKCKNRVIVFASCSTLRINKRLVKKFIEETGCLAVCGYRADVDWIKSTAFELLLIEGMQDNEFSGRGMPAIQNYLKGVSKAFPELEFIMVIRGE
ncbi:MAG: hypothetical protein KDI62_03845 [Anaerolineae bacterium]|nr:hypothetical protein [Anaerolineae bacterium]MCB0177340.1 hypothetical protein [Anaerolineae bacterium]MCB9104457.1 hypothetical protein [Anaerolineales bacterium]